MTLVHDVGAQEAPWIAEIAVAAVGVARVHWLLWRVSQAQVEGPIVSGFFVRALWWCQGGRTHSQRCSPVENMGGVA